VRIPTERAHGIQIFKMCDAFAQLGHNVTLMYPHRNQLDNKLVDVNPFNYYGMTPSFRLKKIASLDFNVIEKTPLRAIIIYLYTAFSNIWAFFACLCAKRGKGDIYYTRDTVVAFWAVLLGLPVIFELHSVPKRLYRIMLKLLCRNNHLRKPCHTWKRNKIGR